MTIAADDLDAAFSIVHDLKGLTGNLSLTPLYQPICEMTEKLRSRTKMDYAPLISLIQ